MKKKVLAKSTRAPNKLFKELCRREAGKSEVTIGNMRSVFKNLANLLTENDTLAGKCMKELERYIEHVSDKNWGVKSSKCDFKIALSDKDYDKVQKGTKARKAAVKKSKALGEK